jgi:lipoprotein
MRKLLILLPILILSLSGCSKAQSKISESGVTEEYKVIPEEKEYKDKVIDALKNKDIDSMKSLFSKNARNNIEDFDFNIALLMKKFTDEFVSAKYDRRLPLVTEDKDRGIERIETYYVVESKRGNDKLAPRFMYIQVVTKDDEDPDEVGISSMMFSPEIWQITMDDSNRGHYLWVDNPFWADYVDTDDVMTTESSR